MSINLIRYPNNITLFFIDFAMAIIFDLAIDKNLREMMFRNVTVRMIGIEEPIGWGLIYMVYQITPRKGELESGGISQELIQML